VLYLLGQKREEICFENTHLLDWEKTKQYLNEDFIQRVLMYEVRGSKPEVAPKYAFVNRITLKMEKIDIDQIY